MQHSFFFALTLSLLSTVSSFTVPTNQVDGIYSVHRSPSGDETHTPHSSPPPSRRADEPLIPNLVSAISEVARLVQWGQVHCMCGIVLSHEDTDAAVNDLKSQLGTDGKIMKPQEACYSIKGSVVAYVCNMDGNAPLKAWADVVSGSTEKISKARGNYMAGDTGGTTGVAVGYVPYEDGAKFCDQALTSGADSCDDGM
jgi:hypothetical protein